MLLSLLPGAGFAGVCCLLLLALGCCDLTSSSHPYHRQHTLSPHVKFVIKHLLQAMQTPPATTKAGLPGGWTQT